MREVRIVRGNLAQGDALDAELVERKGIGHPDSLMDGIAERVSSELCRAYLDRAGGILHHNVDKGLLAGGTSSVKFGGGRITRRMEVIIAGRAAFAFDGTRIDADGIAIDAARKYLGEKTRFVDVDSDVIFSSKLGRGSSELRGMFSSGDRIAANDTAFGLGFAPLSRTEELVLMTERYLNSREYKRRVPATGEDIKVMGLREGSHTSLTIAVAFVSKSILSIEDYVKSKRRVAKDAMRFAAGLVGEDVDVVVNSGDSTEDGRIYLTKTGLSCESGDDGQVGRGNRVNGLITPFRRMSLEAAAGKNPVSHIGKLYNVLAMNIAGDVVREYPMLKSCDVQLLARIGDPIEEPRLFRLELGGSREAVNKLGGKAQEIAEWNVDNIQELSSDIIDGEYEMF
jgi:S-adenosylmethionine synthetase